MNSKFYFKAFVFGIALLPVAAFAQQTETKTIDQFNELNQLLPKNQTPAFPKVEYRDGKVFVPATKVRINGKDTMIKTPLYTVMPGKAIATYLNKPNSLQGYVAVPYPDRIPTLKPDMSQYRMPNMIQQILKKPGTVPLQDTVGKK
jgi:hypothetical protein